MAGESQAIITEIIDALSIIRFHKPAERNPLSISALHNLENELSTLTKRSDVEAIVFTGTDDVFASGANIRELAQLDSESAIEFSQLGQGVFQTIADARQLTIAAINGYCMGGALDLALACDIRVASKSAVFAHPGARLGIITGWGGTQRFPLLVGKTRSLEMFLTARNFGSDEALSMGLVTGVNDPVLQFAMNTCRQVLTQLR